ncbi:MAG: tetratricopeptide repeat protein [Tepidisphaeraceae bacterium]
MNSKDALNLARRHHRAGELGEAEKIYRRVLQNQPNHPEALHLLGALVGQRGDTEAAIDLIRRSIALNSPDAEAHRNLGALLAQSKRYDEALACFSKAAQLRPEDAQTHQDIGNIYTIQNRVDEAIAAYQKAVALKPGFFAAYVSLGDALSKKGRIDEALSAYSRAAQLNPNVAVIHNNIGKLLFKKGRFDEAILAHSTAVRLKADFAMAYFALGHAYRAAGPHRLEDALAAYRQAVNLKPDLIDAYVSMALILAAVQRFDEALECHVRAAELQPNAAITHEALGAIMLRQRGAAAAVEHFRRAVAIDPTLFSAWNSLGVALESQGRFDEAADCFRQMLTIRPDSIVAHRQLVASSRQKASQTEIEPLMDLLRQPNLTTEQRISAEFALGTALDDAERFEEAFSHFAQGNSLEKERRALTGDRYDPDAFRALTDQQIETFTPEFFEKRRGWIEPSELPVFVMGMPRSGTTLVHQIAASHPRVYGAGELNDISYISDALKNNGKASAPMWTAESLKEASRRHLQRLQSFDANALRVVDKMPGNLHYLGLIALLFPAARIVLCRRDPRDTCLSCYFQGFTRGNTFSFDLAHCGHYHVENDRLLAHWLRVLPLAMLEVQYENVVADLEGQSRRLIDFLGLPWDPACLEFHRAPTTVLTPSIWQVRQPIYQKSAGRWRHYERRLGPLLKSLGL